MSTPEPLIRDIPTLRKTLDDVRAVGCLKRAMPLLRPLFRILGANTEQIDEALANLDGQAAKADVLARLPDRFNDLFADRGWIIYDNMNVEVALAAVTKAEVGDLEGAEADLVAYYDLDTVRRGLNTMWAVSAFSARMPLAQKAFEDYEHGRYHACVPVVLALLDGMVNELHEKAHGKRRGFSAEASDLKAWNSVAAHSRGLERLKEVFTAARKKTRAEAISIPYRNGIMHGIDLGYDNPIVAAKTWAALFGVREWALKVQKGEVQAPPAEPEKTWRDQLRDLVDSCRKLQETRAEKESIAEWMPRELVVGSDIRATGSPAEFPIGTPERALAEFLELWRRGNDGHMAKKVFGASSDLSRVPAAQVRSVYGQLELITFSITRVEDAAPAVTEVETDLEYLENGSNKSMSHRFRLVYEDAEGNPHMRGHPDGKWWIVTWAIQ